MNGDNGITRRLLVGQLASLAALARMSRAQSDDDPLRQLRPSHPRLILLDGDLDRVRITAQENSLARRVYGDLERECDRLLTVPPAEYKLVGTRLLVQVRRVLERVATLSFFYRLTSRETYLRRAVAELQSAAAFRDWNPARFSETAELTCAFALGYDWLYNALTPQERTWIRTAIVAKGLDPALPLYEHDGGWPKDRYYANVLCNAGMIAGALAIAGEPGEAGQLIDEKCRAILRAALDSVPRGLVSYGVEGSWPEGPDYWHAASQYTCVMCGCLLTALGNDFGLSSSHGVDRAGRFRIHMTGPAGKVFNFGDSTEDAGLAPEMFWFGRRFANPVYGWSEQRALERTGRPEIWDLIWYARDSKSPQAPPAWPVNALFRGVDVACIRSSWEDPAALYLAVKGGDNKVAHTHLDLGSFVFDAGGVRWASDLGPDDFELPGYQNSRQRWSYYRTRTEAHNTLLIDGENQDPRAEARITRQQTEADFVWVQIELSRANPGRVKQWTRRIGMAQRQSVLISDTLHSDQPVDAIWGMMTDADVTLSGQTATLHKGGWTLGAEIRSPRRAVFDVAPVHAAPPQAQNSGYRKLIVRLGDKVTDLDLTIQLTPYKDGQPKPKINAQFPA